MSYLVGVFRPFWSPLFLSFLSFSRISPQPFRVQLTMVASAILRIFLVFCARLSQPFPLMDCSFFFGTAPLCFLSRCTLRIFSLPAEIQGELLHVISPMTRLLGNIFGPHALLNVYAGPTTPSGASGPRHCLCECPPLRLRGRTGVFRRREGPASQPSSGTPYWFV